MENVKNKGKCYLAVLCKRKTWIWVNRFTFSYNSSLVQWRLPNHIYQAPYNLQVCLPRQKHSPLTHRLLYSNCPAPKAFWGSLTFRGFAYFLYLVYVHKNLGPTLSGHVPPTVTLWVLSSGVVWWLSRMFIDQRRRRRKEEDHNAIATFPAEITYVPHQPH